MAETDPYGKDQHESGAKVDAGKNRLGLVLGGFALALEQVGWVGTFGQKKYSPNGWLSVPDGQERYKDALYRHLLAYERGENVDKDSDLLHLAHLAWNALAVLEKELRK